MTLHRPATLHPAGPARQADSPEPPPDRLRMPVNLASGSLAVLAVIAVVLLLRYAEAMIIPIVLGVLISYAVDPIVSLLVRWRIPRPFAAAVVLLALVGAGGTLLYSLRFEAEAIVQQLPQGARRVRQLLERNGPSQPTAIEQVQKAATELEKAADAAVPPPPRSGVTRVQVEAAPFKVTDYLMWGSLGVAAAAAQVILVLFLAYFLLASGDLIKRKLVKVAGPSITNKKITLQILEEIDRQIARFLLVQLFSSTVVAVATWLVFRWLGVEHAAVWGILAGLFNSIPYFGPVLVSGGTALVAFLQFGDMRMAAIVAAAAMAITTLEGFLLTPWLSSRAARMNAVAIFVGLLFWGWVWDIWGMLLAVPMMMVVKAVCDQVDDLKGVGELLGE